MNYQNVHIKRIIAKYFIIESRTHIQPSIYNIQTHILRFLYKNISYVYDDILIFIYILIYMVNINALLADMYTLFVIYNFYNILFSKN